MALEQPLQARRRASCARRSRQKAIGLRNRIIYAFRHSRSPRILASLFLATAALRRKIDLRFQRRQQLWVETIVIQECVC